ncbi:MAG TPA: hypothetical protein VJA25_13475 [Dehalococcoidia bacterium]|nr:hypothetical protein [Dehalococcoidia bacterium]
MSVELTVVIRFEEEPPEQDEFEKVVEARWYGAYVVEYETEEV